MSEYPQQAGRNLEEFIEAKYGLDVVYGTHPIPEKYLTTHSELGTWKGERWKEVLQDTMCDEATRKDYN